MNRSVSVLALLLLTLVRTGTAQAHVASNSFLVVNIGAGVMSGSIELAVRDLEPAIEIDTNHDGKLTWGELRASAPLLREYVVQHLHFAAGKLACSLSVQGLQVNDRVDGSYAWLPWTAHCPAAIKQLEVRYTLLQDIDPSHRGLLTLTSGATVQTAVLGGTAAPVDFDVDHPSLWRTLREYFQAGVWHIWSGIDHLLFLLSLLLPAVLLRRNDQWQPVPAAPPALLSVLKVVTAFTLAHSITLSLAAFELIRLPSRLTESAIAASIIVAALNNVFPVVTERRARIAFCFGLLHGFGFASVLADMGLPSGARLSSLVAFNCGIECGQLAVVLLVMPLAYGVRREGLYRRALLPLGSLAIALLATVWLAQRALGP